MNKFLAAIMFCLTLTACSESVPPLDFTPSDVLPTGKKVNAGVKDISISFAKPQERVGSIQVGFGGNQYESSFKSTFEDSLQEALIKSAIFNDYAKRKVLIVAKVMQLETPTVGLAFTTQMVVRYSLLDTSSGKLLFTRDIKTSGTVEMGYAFLGATRMSESRNRAVRSSIEDFISSLGEAKI
jgi:hypothetical protein